MELVESATEVKSSSDYMTEQVRNYVISGNIYNLNNYIAESNSDVEDKALEKIGETNLSFYDVQYILTYSGTEENTNFPIFGAKKSTSTKVVWSKVK